MHFFYKLILLIQLTLFNKINICRRKRMTQLKNRGAKIANSNEFYRQLINQRFNEINFNVILNIIYSLTFVNIHKGLNFINL